MVKWFYHRPVSVPLGKIPGTNGGNLRLEIFPSVDAKTAMTGGGIPEQLSFERCIQNELCWPLRIQDFMNYLRFEEYSSENLKFFLWYKDYVSRWEKLPQEEKDLSPEWNHHAFRERANSKVDADLTNGHGGDIDIEMLNARKSFQLQPFRSEVFRIASLFLGPRGPLELNLSTRERQQSIEALSHTTHPSAFLPMAQATEHVLRYQSYPNLLLRQLCLRRRNRYRLIVGYTNLVFFALLGILGSIFLILCPWHRAWRLIPALSFWCASMIAFSCWRGICAVLYIQRDTLIDPWDNPEEFATRIAGQEKKKMGPTDEESRESQPYRIVRGGFPAGHKRQTSNNNVRNAKDALSALETTVTEDSSSAKDTDHDGDDGGSDVGSANDVYLDDVDVVKAKQRMAEWNGRSFYGKAMTDHATIREAELRRLLVTTFSQNCVLGILPTIVFLVIIMPIPSYGVLFPRHP